MADYVNHGDDRELSAREPEDRIGSLEGGDYVVELMASRGVRLTGSNSGAVLLWFTIRFLDGPRRGRELRMSIIVDGPPAMSLLVRRGLQVLDDWRRGTGTQPAPGYVSLLRDIARNSRRASTIATLGRTVTTRGDVITTIAQNPHRRSEALMCYAFTLMQSAEAGIAAKTVTRMADGTN